jgi:hypothetical protein
LRFNLVPENNSGFSEVFDDTVNLRGKELGFKDVFDDRTINDFNIKG